MVHRRHWRKAVDDDGELACLESSEVLRGKDLRLQISDCIAERRSWYGGTWPMHRQLVAPNGAHIDDRTGSNREVGHTGTLRCLGNALIQKMRN